jgi:hypothetical protein
MALSCGKSVSHLDTEEKSENIKFFREIFLPEGRRHTSRQINGEDTGKKTPPDR